VRISELRMLVLLICVSSGLSAGALFNFDADVVGRVTPFVDSNSGISLTFFSNGDPGGFKIYGPGSPAAFVGLTGNVLADPGTSPVSGIAMTIDFNAVMNSISMNFAIISGSPASFTMFVYQDQAHLIQVGSVTATDAIPPGFTFPEGVISFSGAGFTSIALLANAPDFAIDNVTVTSMVPEPTTFAPVALVILSGYLARRRKFSAK
jgi:hypothetical protein